MASNFHCCPIFFFLNFFCLISMSMLWRICVYVHISDHVNLSMSYHCYHTILSVKRFYTNQEWCKGMTGYLSLGASLTVTGWIRNIGQNILQSFCQTRSSRNPTYFQIFFFVFFHEEAFIRNIIIILCINYTI